jgi:hypothetical protein
VSSVCWQTEAAIGVIRGIGFMRKHPLGEHSTQSGANVRNGRIRDICVIGATLKAAVV